MERVGDICISAITYCELEFGAAKSRHPKKNQEANLNFLAPLNLLDFPIEAASICGALRADLNRKGTPIGPFDLLIAAHALYLNTTLVTNNIKEFNRVENLKLENWISSQ
jgi:tRNA(fMet)-specific endonuclease VapC